MSAPRVVFIGAGSDMCRVAIEQFALAPGDWQLVLAETRPDLLTSLVDKLPKDRATAQHLDFADENGLQALIKGASLVVLGVGPYSRTSDPILKACLAAKVGYLDLNDDVPSTEHVLSLNKEAQDAGIPLYVGCGAAPGMSNVLVVDASNDLETVDNIDVAWLAGDERPSMDRVVLEHVLLNVAAGESVTWERGQRIVHESFVETAHAPMLAGEPEVLLYETSHPETVTLPRRFPEAQRIRSLGAFDPVPLNGLIRGLALAVQDGKLSISQAVDFADNLAAGGVGSSKGWRHAVNGIVRQVRRSETNTITLLKFLVTAAARRPSTYRGSILARVYGTKAGKPAISMRRIDMRADLVFNDMAGVCGTACAAFALLALDQAGLRAGAFAPEDWADPALFYNALERVGVPRHQIVRTVY